MKTDLTIILIGPMSAGKSTIGKLLAEKLGIPQYSVDDVRWDYYREIGYDEAETTDIIVTVEAQHDGAYQDVQHAVEDLLELLKAYAGGTYESAILNLDRPAI